MNKYPEAVTQLEALSDEIKQQKEEAKQAAIENGESVDNNSEALNNFDFDKILKSDFSLPVGKNLVWLKNLYSFNTAGFPIVLILLTGIFAVIIFLSNGIKSKLKWSGLTFLLSGIWNGAVYFAGIFLGKFFINVLNQNSSHIPSYVFPVVSVFSDFMMKNFMDSGKIMFVVFLAAGVICLAVAWGVPQQAVQQVTLEKKTVKKIKKSR